VREDALISASVVIAALTGIYSTLPTLPQIEPVFERFTQAHAPLPALPIKPCHGLGIILEHLPTPSDWRFNVTARRYSPDPTSREAQLFASLASRLVRRRSPTKRTPSVTVWGPLAPLGPKTAFVVSVDGGAVSHASKQALNGQSSFALAVKVTVCVSAVKF